MPPPNRENKLLSPPARTNIGPMIGIVLILTLLIFGALYFMSEHFKRVQDARNNIPYIPSGTSTVTIKHES